MTIEGNRNLGKTAAILFSLGIISSITSLIIFTHPTLLVSLGFLAVSGILGVAGFIAFILFLVAMYGLSRDYGEHRIFNYILYGLLAAIIAGVLAIIISIAVFLTYLPHMSALVSSSLITSLLAPYTPAFAAIGLVWIFFNYKSFQLLSNKSGVPLFSKGALVLLTGSIVSVVIAAIYAAVSSSFVFSSNVYSALSIPGSIIQGVAWILFAMAYSRITLPATQPFTATAQPAPQTAYQSWGANYCSYCGQPIKPGSLYCSNCGHKL